MSFLSANRTERNAWIIAQRGARAEVTPTQPYGFFVEDELSSSREIIPVATILLTNRECPWKCVMCDLWKNTMTVPVAKGAIPAQIEFALTRLPRARQIKLYNSGSFFDSGAIPTEDFAAIANLVRSFERVIVESHPALISPRVLEFKNKLNGHLEVAMGLETAHPEVLQQLNKGMDLQQFSRAASMLSRNGIDLRTFILVQPPFLPPSEALYWAERSIDFALENHSSAVTLIPTRGGNGAMESLAREGLWVKPSIRTLEAALEYGIMLREGRVFADLWSFERGPLDCIDCFETLCSRLQRMNYAQQVLPRAECVQCENNC